MWEFVKSVFSCNSVENISSVIMTALLVGLFLTVFFFTYVSNVEGGIVVTQIKFLADNFSESVKLLPAPVQTAIKTEINNIALPNFTETNNQIDAANNKLIKKTLIFVVSILLIVMVVIYILSMNKLCHFSFWEMLGKNLIILAFVALTEFTFLNLIPKNFISVDPNYVKYYALNQLYPNSSSEEGTNGELPNIFGEIKRILTGEYAQTINNKINGGEAGMNLIKNTQIEQLLQENNIDFKDFSLL